MHKEKIKENILNILNDEQYNSMKTHEIAKILELEKEDKDDFYQEIDKMLLEGEIYKNSKGKIVLPETLNIFEGNFQGNERGFGFVTIQGREHDIFIKESSKNGAMHKDKVLIKINSEKQDGKRAEGSILKILERGFEKIVGLYRAERNFGFVIADDKKIGSDIYISKKNRNEAVNGHKVVIKIIKAATENSKPEGEILEILGHLNDPGVDILSILKQRGVETDFSDEIYKEIELIKDEIPEEEIKCREDLRMLEMVTIDGEESRDLDDAVSIQLMDNGNFKLGVHIADVSHYVDEKTELGKECYKRATSIYIVDRVIPMLPRKISNGICSLNPKVDRLALSCFMEINNDGQVVEHRIFKSVINVDRRMTYNIVSDLIINKDSEYIEEYSELIPTFNNMETLAKILKANRVRRGSLEFDFPETKIKVDENGKPIEIKAAIRNFATGIIEEFMLVCNETIAEHFFWLEVPFVYRSHEEPDKEKLEKLSDFVYNFGYNLKGKGNFSKTIQQLSYKVKNLPEEMVINRFILRSLKQAKYTNDNLGHFGLSAKYYCHFTSPIRRYPDLQIHRIIKKHIDGGLDKKYKVYLNKNIVEICAHSSTKERNAELIEREVNDLKKAEFMIDKVGQTFEGVISGVTNWGIYVELDNTVEGMVSIDSLKDDTYNFYESRMMYVGERTKKIYKIGDKVTIEVDRVNVQARNIDFIFKI